MPHPIHSAVALLMCIAVGCGRPALPPSFAIVPSTNVSASDYPVRSDLMVVGKTGLDGAPQRWPSPGFPPLRSALIVNRTPDPDFAEEIRKQFGKNVLNPGSSLNPSQATDFPRLLASHFGTPAEPMVRVPTWEEVTLAAVVRPNPENGIFENMEAIETALRKWKSAGPRTDWDAANAAKAALKLDDATLGRGSVLYRRWCLQCHGPSGAGDGAHAIELAAMPRDYRQGIFKFITAFPKPGQPKKGGGPSGKPRREDLKRTIHNGLEGSMMPAFSALSESEIDDLASYVIHLSIRGETEFATMTKAMQPGEEDPDFVGPELEWLFDQNLMWVLGNWAIAQRSPIPIPPENTPTEADRLASATRGVQRYTEFGCASCHVSYGREPALKWDLWGTVVQPRNFLLGVYRGGRRGEDLYARIYGGIYPSGMPAHFDRLVGGPSDPDQPDKIWDLVHFLEAIADPYDREHVIRQARKTDASFKIEP